MAKYSAIYYPDCYVGNGRAMATYMLLYDELHFVAIADNATNPTERLRKLPNYTNIKTINNGKPNEFAVNSNEILTVGDLGELDKQTRRVLLFYQFVQRYKILIGDTLFFHPHLLSSAMTRFTDKLLGTGVDLDEFTKFMTGEDEELSVLAKFQAEFPAI